MKPQLLHRRRLLQALLLPAAAALAGCATTASPEADRAALLQRARAFWQVVQANDGPAAWTYEELSKKPGWTLQAYLKREGITYNDAQVQDVVSLEGDKAVVAVKINYSIPLLRMNDQNVLLQDEWVRIDGQWYHADRRSIL